jgi:hypothetical protein
MDMHKVSAAFIILVSLVFAVLSQDTSVAKMIDSYEGTGSDAFVDRVHAFVERLKTEPGTTRGAMVFYYKYKWVTDCRGGKMEEDRSIEQLVRKIISLDSEIDDGRIEYIAGQLGGRHQVEFWLVPFGAKLPEAREIDFDPPCCCPSATVLGAVTAKAGKKLRFAIDNSDDLSSWLRAPINWKVSAGTIISGQGTTEITVDPGNMKEGDISASIELEIAHDCSCPKVFSATTKIVPEPPAKKRQQ